MVECQITSKIIHEEILILFCSEKYHSGGAGGGDIAIIASSSRSRSHRDCR